MTRGARSAVRLGASFEDTVDLALVSPRGCFARGHPASKIVGRGAAARMIYTAKNGVDFVGSWDGRAMALEAKRLPKAASLRGSKDDATQAEAAFLLRFRATCSAAHDPAAAFLVYDPERALIYVVHQAADLATLAGGGFVPLTKGHGSVLAFTATPTTIIGAVRAIVEAL